MDELKSFSELYGEAKGAKPVLSPGRIFISEVAKLTKKSENTVRMWLYGSQTPDKLTLEVLSNHFDTPAEVLFPSLTTKKKDKIVKSKEEDMEE